MSNPISCVSTAGGITIVESKDSLIAILFELTDTTLLNPIHPIKWIFFSKVHYMERANVFCKYHKKCMNYYFFSVFKINTCINPMYLDLNDSDKKTNQG